MYIVPLPVLIKTRVVKNKVQVDRTKSGRAPSSFVGGRAARREEGFAFGSYAWDFPWMIGAWLLSRATQEPSLGRHMIVWHTASRHR